MSTIMEVPPEINFVFASFLSPHDVIKFQNSCKYLKNSIPLNLLQNVSPTKIKDLCIERFHYHDRDEIKFWATLTPFLFSNNSIHSVNVMFNYMDVGWGNSRGYVYITEKHMDQENNQGIGTIIATSPLAEHHETKCKLSFKPRNNNTYHLCYKTNNAHGLFVRNIKVTAFVHCASVHLANMLFPTLPDAFLLNTVRFVLDTVKDTVTNKITGPLVRLFASVGLDLSNPEHIRGIQVLLNKLESIKIQDEEQKEQHSNLLHNVSLTNIQNLDTHGGYYDGDEIKFWTTLTPFLFPNLIRSVNLMFDYKDQGWGNRKGYVYITEKHMDQENNQGIGTIIATSPLAEHHETKCTLSFKPRNNNTYHLYYKVGGGGGHGLFVRNIKVTAFVHCASVHLANSLFPTLPDAFFLNTIRLILDTGTHEMSRRLVPLLASVDLDLNNPEHIRDIQVVLDELDSVKIQLEQ